ncbi:hypothetical protein ACFC9I_05810 [Enterococcus casseliflavus]|uniref:hypothetical protein n=1 Tax=Enterococcus casseliflavus TaxID=37734 RepID=UPI0039A69767
MKKKLLVNFPDGQGQLDGTFDVSDTCPHCKRPIDPIVKSAHSDSRHSNGFWVKVAIVLLCPSSDCSQFFLDWFKVKIGDYGNITQTNRLEYVYKPILKNDLPSEVNERFPDFEAIYSQSLQAESYGLDQIAGVGYRKALEFLIKHYAIHTYPDKEDSIKKETLNNTIMNRLGAFPKLQTLAQAATWIGNDETHFVRKHEDKDITSMKKFIKSAATFISADLDADEALNFTQQN